MDSIVKDRKNYRCFNAQSRYLFQFCRGQAAAASSFFTMRDRGRRPFLQDATSKCIAADQVSKKPPNPSGVFLTGRMGIPKTTKRKQLAVIFECDVKTIYNEIKRGTVDHLMSELETVYVYNAEYAQHKAD